MHGTASDAHIIPIRRTGSGEVPVWPDRKTLPNWVLGLPVSRPEHRITSADSVRNTSDKAGVIWEV